MAEQYSLDHFVFDNKTIYEQAQKEKKGIDAMRKRYDIQKGKVALAIYNKALDENIFSTEVGYQFLFELRHNILACNAAKEEELRPIHVVSRYETTSFVKEKVSDRSKFMQLYEMQCAKTKRLRIVVIALLALLIAFIVIDYKSEYSIFTYFTDYKQNMEDELVNKYEEWENDLNAREEQLKQREAEGGKP